MLALTSQKAVPCTRHICLSLVVFTKRREFLAWTIAPIGQDDSERTAWLDHGRSARNVYRRWHITNSPCCQPGSEPWGHLGRHDLPIPWRQLDLGEKQKSNAMVLLQETAETLSSALERSAFLERFACEISCICSSHITTGSSSMVGFSAGQRKTVKNMSEIRKSRCFVTALIGENWLKSYLPGQIQFTIRTQTLNSQKILSSENSTFHSWFKFPMARIQHLDKGENQKEHHERKKSVVHQWPNQSISKQQSNWIHSTNWRCGHADIQGKVPRGSKMSQRGDSRWGKADIQNTARGKSCRKQLTMMTSK